MRNISNISFVLLCCVILSAMALLVFTEGDIAVQWSSSGVTSTLPASRAVLISFAVYAAGLLAQNTPIKFNSVASKAVMALATVLNIIFILANI